MTTLRIILDDVIASPAGGTTRYAEELARHLIATAPRGSNVAGIVSASPEPAYAHLAERVPGLLDVYKSPLARRELAAAWQHGFTRLPGSGMVHATSLLAPLSRHTRDDARGSQMVVTIHDAVAWTDSELLSSREVGWANTMTKRAERFADAVVVPTHAVADVLAEHFSFGDRLRVIGGAPSSRLRPVPDAAQRRAELGVGEDFLLAVSGLEPRKGADALFAALAILPELRLVLVGPGSTDELTAAAGAAGIAPNRVLGLAGLEDADLAAVFQGASLFIQPGRAEGFGLAMVEAFAFGLPVVHSDAPALLEVAAGAGVAVPLGPSESYPERLADAIRGLLDDDALRERLAIAASDRARAFSWRDSAEKVWQLHADL